jgi:peptidoglycan hydrolase CwlO-like protein
LKRKFVSLAAVLAVNITFVSISSNVSTVHGESLEEIKKKREQNGEKEKKKKSELNSVKNEQNKVQDGIQEIDNKIYELEQNIKEKSTEKEDIILSIDSLKKSIAIIEKRIETRDKLLKNRVSAMYEDGGVIQYLDVLLGSKDFGDFLDRIIALNLIAEQDREIIEEHKLDQRNLKLEKQKVDSKLSQLEVTLTEMKTLEEQLSAQRDEKNRILAELKIEEGKINNYLIELDEKNKLLANQESAIKAEMERARKAELERKKKEMEKSKRVQSASSSPVQAETSDEREGKTGMFLFPTEGTLTSTMGPRWGKEHAGIDIAKAGTVPIVAAESGTVLRSYYSSSYGNVVFISHYINGQLYTTVYAHMNSRSVQDGQTVSRGQLVGYQGNTGNSFGQHLHFELHKGPWNSGKTNAINPMPLLSR